MTGFPKTDTFQQALHEHHELRDLNETLAEFLERPRPSASAPDAGDWTTALHGHLSSLHAKLVRHFRREEEGGILDELEIKSPRAAKEIGRIRAEHGEILASLRELAGDTMAYAEAAEPPDPHLRQRTKDLLGRLADHEARETDLIQDLVLTDISAGD